MRVQRLSLWLSRLGDVLFGDLQDFQLELQHCDPKATSAIQAVWLKEKVCSMPISHWISELQTQIQGVAVAVRE